MQNLITFGEISPIDIKSAKNCLNIDLFEGINQNFDLFPAKCSRFTTFVWFWIEIIESLIISLSSLVIFTRFMYDRITFGLLYWNFNEVYQLVSFNQLKYINNRTYKHRFSTNDKYGFGVVCRMYRVHSTKPFMFGLWEVFMFVWLESLFIGSYVYHSDVIAGALLHY